MDFYFQCKMSEKLLQASVVLFNAYQRRLEPAYPLRGRILAPSFTSYRL
jgi:hypothetical protein